MGGHAYWYFVPYQEDLQTALDELREREHAAGRYNPVIRFLKFAEPAFSAQQPGPQHETIRAAVKAAREDGTRSILDISEISDTSEYGCASPLSVDTLRRLYKTDKPTRKMLEANREYLEEIDRGKCRYVIVHDTTGPSEILFAGYSYD